MNTLIINAYPDFSNQESYSNKLQTLFEEQFKQTFPNSTLTTLNLYETKVPRIENGELLSIWQKQQNGIPLTVEEIAIATASNNLLTQFKEHHRIVIVSPLHNFNVTSRMKDYIDNVLIARETFKYTEDGSVGLMTDDYEVMLLQASGSIYTNNDRYTPLEFSHFYLKEMFVEMMGFNDFHIVRAQGTALLPEEEVMTTAERDIQSAIQNFYH